MAYTTINKGSSYFNTILYTGTGASNARTGVGFQPDWVWIKGRSGATDHGLYDVVRGVQNQIESNTTTAETAEATGLTAFGTDGFTVGALAQLNTSSATYVAWNWLANGAGVSNTAGTIASTVSANTTSGFSIVSWTGTGANATVGHGLGVVPKMIIVKNRSAVEDWAIYHSTLGNTKFLEFTVGAAQTSSTIWNDTSPTSTLFTVGTNSKVNGNTNNMIAYCFAEIKGYNKIGSFVGNGSANGTFVYTGFKPAYIIQKKSTTGSANAHWRLIDSTRSPFNVSQDVLFPGLSNTEASGETDLDILSNGFKIREGGIYLNESGITYIYMAFASNPFVSSTLIPTTAR